MKPITVIAGLLVAICALSEVSCLTNREFFELVKDYAEDIQEFDIDDPTDDDVIELPGNDDDEIDMLSLMASLNHGEELDESKLTQSNKADSSLVSDRDVVGPAGLTSASCRCSGNSCNCCYTRRFKVFRRSFRLTACLNVRFVKGNQFAMAIKVNGNTLYRRTQVVRNGLKLCRNVRIKIAKVKVCAEIYNLNLGAKSMCARLSGEVRLIRRFKMNIKLGCFKVPGMEGEDTMQDFLDDGQMSTLDGDDVDAERQISINELLALINQLKGRLEEVAQTGARMFESDEQ